MDTDSIYKSNFQKHSSGVYRHRTVSQGSRTAMWNYETNRLLMFRDYEAMDKDAILCSVLDIIADESTQESEKGEIISVQCTHENIKEILENLFYDILNIEFNLWSWVRNMAKYGDMFLELDVRPRMGIVNYNVISAYDIIRNEYLTEDNQEITFTIQNTERNNVLYGFGKQRKEPKLRYAYEVAHFRMATDTALYPYGKSFFEGARRDWKRLTMMEDAMMINRIMRAPEKRVFYIDVGGIPPAEIDNYMNKVIEGMKKTPYMDPKTGEYNLRYNLENSIEDYYLPVRGERKNTMIESLQGLEGISIDDIEYQKDKMIAGLKVPKAFLNFTEDISGKATLAAEDIRFSRTISRIQKFIVAELTKIARIHLYAQGFEDEELSDFELNLHNPSTIATREKIELWSEKARVSQELKDLGMYSDEYIALNILDMSKQELAEQRVQRVKDAQYKFRIEKIEMDGSDPKYNPQDVDGTGLDDDTYDSWDPEEEDTETEQREDSEHSLSRGDDPLGDKENHSALRGGRKVSHTYTGGSPLSREHKMVIESIRDYLLPEELHD